MWRKIHSDRDPKDTLFSELRKEFRPGIERLTIFTRERLSGNPRTVFSLMLVLLLISAALSFTVFRHPETKNKQTTIMQPAVVSDGFGQLMQAAEKLRETVRLKRIVDSLTDKKQLNAADSLQLDSVLSRLQQIQTLKQ